MKTSTDQLRAWINNYFAAVVTQDELGNWAKNVYYEMMRGDFLILNNLSIYSYVRTVSTFNIKPDDNKDEYPCSESAVKQIQDILTGKVNDTVVLHIQLTPKLFAMSDKFALQNLEQFILLESKLVETHLDGDAVARCIQDFMLKCSPPSKVETVLDLLQVHLFGMLKCSSGISMDRSMHESSIWLYLDKNNRSSEKRYEDIKKMLNCITGKAAFRVCIAYQSGKPETSLLL